MTCKYCGINTVDNYCIKCGSYFCNYCAAKHYTRCPGSGSRLAKGNGHFLWRFVTAYSGKQHEFMILTCFLKISRNILYDIF